MTREQLFLITVGAGAAVGLVWWQWRASCRLWRYWSSFLRNDHHRFFSLARIAACAVILVGQVPVMRHEFFWKNGGAWLVGFEMLILFSDILTSKLAMIVLPALAGRMNLPSVPLPPSLADVPDEEVTDAG